MSANVAVANVEISVDSKSKQGNNNVKAKYANNTPSSNEFDDEDDEPYDNMPVYEDEDDDEMISGSLSIGSSSNLSSVKNELNSSNKSVLLEKSVEPVNQNIFVYPEEEAVDMMSKEFIVSTTDERLSLHKQPSGVNLNQSKSFVDHMKYYSDTVSLLSTSVHLAGGNLDKHLVMKKSIEHLHSTSILSGLSNVSSYENKELEAKANKMLTKIEAKQTTAAIRVFSWILTKLWKLLFKSIFTNVDGVSKLKNAIKKAKANTPILLLPTHKSHIDYLVLSYLHFGFGLPIPHIAAGDNLDLPIIGSLFRYSGSFFIRRKNGNDNLYKATLSTYVSRLLNSGACIEFFIEGGRSRSGVVGAPKVGLLKSIISSYLRKECEDVMIVPVAVDYDRIPEGSSYANMSLGKPKVAESLWNLLGAARTLLFRKHGSVHIRHGDPFSMKALIGTKGDGTEYTIEDEKIVVEHVANTVGASLSSCTCIMSTAILATVILSYPRNSFLSGNDIINGITQCVNTLHALGAKLFVPGTSKDIFEKTLPNIIHLLDQRSSFEGVELYHVSSQRNLATELVMYQNMTMNILLPEAIAALSVSTMTPLYHASLLSQLFEGEVSGIQVYAKVVELLKRSKSLRRPEFLDHYIQPLLESYLVFFNILLSLCNEMTDYQCKYDDILNNFLNAPNTRHVKFIESFTSYRVEILVATLMKLKNIVYKEDKSQVLCFSNFTRDVTNVKSLIKELNIFIK